MVIWRFLLMIVCLPAIALGFQRIGGSINQALQSKPLCSAKILSDTSWVGDEANIKISGVSRAVFTSDGLRGVVANEDVGMKVDEDLSTSAPLVSIPANLALEVTNTRPPTPFPKFVPQKLWEGSLWDQRLAMLLLYERHVKGSSSDKHMWIQQLPDSYSTPYEWSDKLLDVELQYPSLAQRVRRQRKDWNEFFTRWEAAARESEGTDFFASSIKMKDVVWALQTVNSRAFSGVYEGSSPEQRQQLLLFTGILTLVWPLAGLGTWEQSLSTAIAVALSIFLRDVLTSSNIANSKLKRYVVCPFIDMFNHRSGCVSDVSYNYFANQFELRTEGYKEGEQVFLSYGRQSNDRLLQYYGFVDADNCHDVYDFNVNIVELLLKWADEIEAQGGDAIPTSPSLTPEDRLQAVTAALQRTEVTDSTYLGNRRVAIMRGDKVPVRLYRQPPQSLFNTKDGSGVMLNQNSQNSGAGSSIATASGLINRCDDVTVRALRAMYATDAEWSSLKEFRNMQPLGKVMSPETEDKVAMALRAFCRLEIATKPTTLQQDRELLNSQGVVGKKKNIGGSTMDGRAPKDGFGRPPAQKKSKNQDQSGVTMDPSGLYGKDALICTLAFRVEKKALLYSAAGLD
jgi:hypothetical protein